MGLIQVSIPVGVSAAVGWAMGGGCLGDETGGGRRCGLGGARVGEKRTGRERRAPSLGYTYFLTTELLTELLTIHGHGHPLLRKSEPDRGHANCGLDYTKFTGSWKHGLDCTKNRELEIKS